MRSAWHRVTRVLAPILAFILGVITSLAVIAVYQSWVWLVVAALGAFAVLLAPPDGGWLRIPFALGWVSVVILAVLGKPEGDYVLAADSHGYVVLVGGLAVLIGAALTSRTRGEVSREV